MAPLLRSPTTEEVQSILGRALLDADFRKQLIDNPTHTLSILGFTASPNALAFFSKLGGQSFTTAAGDLEAHIAAAPLPHSWD
ncbi:Os1348 family NHLP clan protein [Nitrospirillum iridis]|uniref:Uncharacterized protein n=1 Tax=Nitrospirillum iridis TaxID=765888 RepID=A0A7X0B001_9PROT|nr:Os1348 family NHLP clan protein [Nitrospirillum iridis]MBB6252857.1 hypothetical protein [Nitrospirillum iridis]